MDPDVRAKGPGKCSKCGMKLEAGIKEQVEYPIRLTVSPPHVPAGEPVRLEFRALDPKTLRPVENFETVHERLFHLFVVSEDLRHFEHVHPELDGGAFRLQTRFPTPGHYRLLTDFYPAGGTPQLNPLTVTTAGYTSPMRRAELSADLSPKNAKNLEVELVTEPPAPIAGKKTLLFFKLKPGDSLEPYLGAWGHLLAASDDLIDTIHAHPAIADGGPQVQFNVFFPREAMYRVWVQFQRAGVVNTVEFTVPVSRLK